MQWEGGMGYNRRDVDMSSYKCVGMPVRQQMLTMIGFGRLTPLS
jgi:hypothetical protein